MEFFVPTCPKNGVMDNCFSYILAKHLDHHNIMICTTMLIAFSRELSTLKAGVIATVVKYGKTTTKITLD